MLEPKHISTTLTSKNSLRGVGAINGKTSQKHVEKAQTSKDDKNNFFKNKKKEEREI